MTLCDWKKMGKAYSEVNNLPGMNTKLEDKG